MEPFRFVAPARAYAASYAEALREGLDLDPTSPAEIQQIESAFDEWLAQKSDTSQPYILPDGAPVKKVPETIRWLVDSDGRFIGDVCIRHELTESLRQIGGHIGYAVRQSERKQGHGRRLIAEGIRVAAALGIDEALITCNDDNLGSISLIEGTGGKLQDTIKLPRKSVPTRRYCLKLA